MTVYLLVITLIVISDCICQLADKVVVRKLLLWNSLTILTIISAFRFQVGADYQHYLDIFEWIRTLGRDEIYVEPGFGLLNQFLIAMHWGSWPIFLISSVLLSSALGAFITEFVDSELWCFAVYIYVCGGFFFSSMNLLRQYMAVAIAIYAFILFVKKKRIAAIAIFALAMTFHSSVIVCLIIFPLKAILDRKNKTVIILIIYMIAAMCVVINPAKLVAVLFEYFPRFSAYSQSFLLLDRNGFAVLKVVVPNLIVLYGMYSESFNSRVIGNDSTAAQSELENGNMKIDKLILSGALCFAVSQLLFFGIMVLTRISELFFPFFVAYICKILNRERRESKMFIWFFVVTYYFILTVVTIFLSNGNSVMPYRFVPWLFS